MMALSRTDLTVIHGDARVSCRRLSDVLGFTRIDSFHKLIRAHEEELRDFGEVFRFEAENPSKAGGRPQKGYYLNEHQAVALAMWAATPTARAARRTIVEVFVAWRHGQPAPSGKADPFAQQAIHLEAVCTSLERLDASTGMAQQVTHLPIWSSGRRPDWWWNLEMRDFLTRAHRQITLKAALEHVQRRWPHTPTSVVGIQRYWARLDRVRGMGLVSALPKGAA